MTWTHDTGSRYHTQDTGYYCGAACAMMVLNEIGVPYADLDQDDLYTSNHDNNAQAGWYTDPVGLRHTLVANRPAGFGNTFLVYRQADEASGTQKIIDTLRVYDVSPCVLVYGSMHWIVVRGVQTDVDPASGPYAVEGLWLNNPVHEDNEPHGASDVCGSGGGHGVEGQWVSYATWQDDYFTGCDYDSGDHSLQFVSVCDPKPVSIAAQRVVARRSVLRGERVATPAAALRVVPAQLAELGLDRAKRLAGFNRGTLGAPLLVQRLDDPGRYYYLIPSAIGGAKGKVGGYVQVDAVRGNVQSVISLRRPTPVSELDPIHVSKRLVDTRLELPGELGRHRLTEGSFRVAKRLVWRPCRESYAPHLPFWEVTSRGRTYYARIDGPVFPALSFTGNGM